MTTVLLDALAGSGASLDFLGVFVFPVVFTIPIILSLLGSMFAAMLKPSTHKAIAKTIWRNRILVAGMILAAIGLYQLNAFLWREYGQGKGGAVQGGGEWTAFRGGPGRRGARAGDPDPVSGGVVWSFKGGYNTYVASPAYAGDSIYAVSADKGVFVDRGTIFRIEAATGRQIWRCDLKGFRATFSSPAVDGKYVVCGEGMHFTRDARIVCIAADTGRLVWEHRTASHVESSPCIYRGRVYVGAGDDGFYCLELAGSGGKAAVRWHLGNDKYKDCEACPIAGDGRVYFCLGMGGMAIVCVDSETGVEIWKKPAPYPVFGSPTLVGGRLVVGMGNGNFVETAEQVRASELKRLREKGVSGEELKKAEKQLSKTEGEIWCLDAKTGETVWTQKVGRTILGAIAHAEGQLYVGSCDGTLSCFSIDGKLVASRKVHEPIKVSPAVGGNNVYVMTESGRIHGFDRKRLAPVWDARVGSGRLFFSSPALGGGHIYVGTEDNGLMCLGQSVVEQGREWNGFLGGPGQTGWADRTPPSAAGRYSWRFPEEQEDDSAGASAGGISVAGPIAVDTNAVYVGLSGASNGLVCLALDKDPRRKPRELWFHPVTNGIHGTAAFCNGKVFVIDGKPGDSGRMLWCLAAATGRAEWAWPLAAGFQGEFCLVKEGILMSDGVDRVSFYGYGTAMRSRWSAAAPAPVGLPLEHEGIVFAVSGAESRLRALSSFDGSLLWEASLDDMPRTGAVADGVWVAVGTAGGVTAFSVCTGVKAWSIPCGGVVAPLTSDGSRIMCATDKPEVVVLSPQGKIVGRTDGTVPAVGSLLCGDSMLGFVRDSIVLTDFASGGSSVWLARTGWMGVPSGPAVMVDGCLYFTSTGKGLVCIGPK